MTNLINNSIINNITIDNGIIDYKKGENMAVKDHSLDEKITKAAMEEFKENDFLKASLNKIAEKAGLTTGAVYTRYKSKDELFGSLVHPLIEEMRQRLYPLEKAYSDVRDSKNIDDVLKVIRLERRIYVDILFAYYDECILLFCRSGGSSVERQADLPGRNDLPDRKRRRLPAAGSAAGNHSGIHGNHPGSFRQPCARSGLVAPSG